MQIDSFEKYKSSLLFRSVLGWVVSFFSALQDDLFSETVKSFLKKNKYGNSEINSLVLFSVTLWFLSFTLGQLLQQFFLWIYVWLYDPFLKFNFLNKKKKQNIFNRLLALLQLYIPVCIITFSTFNIEVGKLAITILEHWALLIVVIGICTLDMQFFDDFINFIYNCLSRWGWID